MTKAKAQDPARTKVGDLVIIEGHRVGEARRMGEILGVVGEGAHEHYRVRWDDGHESVFYPSSDATIRHKEHAEKSA